MRSIKLLVALTVLAAVANAATQHYVSGTLNHPNTAAGSSSDLVLENHETAFTVGWPLDCSPDQIMDSMTHFEYYQGTNGVVTVRFVNDGTEANNPTPVLHHCALNNYDD